MSCKELRDDDIFPCVVLRAFCRVFLIFWAWFTLGEYTVDSRALVPGKMLHPSDVVVFFVCMVTACLMAASVKR